MIDVVEIYVHWYAGRSKSALAASLGVDRKTVQKYLAPAEAAGLVPGGPPVSEAQWAERVREWFPQLADTRLRQVTWPAIEVHRDYIAAQMKAGVTMATIHQRLRDEQDLATSVASLRRWVRANLPEEVRRAQVTVLRLEPPRPGAEAQIDYGRLGMWLDPLSGKRRTVQAFVMVLCCSRHMFVRPVIKMDQSEWTRCHVEAFAFFGGVPARLVPDNLKTGVDRPDLYDPKVNRSYGELAVHYGTLIDPARAAKPRDKPQVERPIPYVRDSFWRGREFASLPRMRTEALRWCREVAGQRPCRPLEGAAPLAVFTAVEAGALRPLPVEPFVLAEWSRATVCPDIHVKVGASLYSIPWRYIGQRVDARATESTVQFFAGGELIKTHIFKQRGKQTDLSDYPPEKIAFFMRTPAWCRRRAAEIGPAVSELIAILLLDNALYRLRAAQGVLGLVDKHTPQRLDAACRKAIDVGDPSYRTVKGILIAGTEDLPDLRPTGDGGAPAFLHGQKAFAGQLAHVIPFPTAEPSPGTDQRDNQRDDQRDDPVGMPITPAGVVDTPAMTAGVMDTPATAATAAPARDGSPPASQNDEAMEITR